MNTGGDFALYVARASLRRFRVTIYHIDTREVERYVCMDFVKTFFRGRARRHAEELADAYYCDQTKSKRSLGMFVLGQPSVKVRFVADDSPEARK